MEVQPIQLAMFKYTVDLDAIPFPPDPPRYNQALRAWVLDGCGVRVFESADDAGNYHRYLTSLFKARSYLMVDCEGDLLDTRGDLRVLRKGYSRFHSRISSGQDLRATLRALPYSAYKDSAVFVAYDGSTICPHCILAQYSLITLSIRAQLQDDSHIIACDIHYEADHGSPLTCDECSRVIPPVYAED